MAINFFSKSHTQSKPLVLVMLGPPGAGKGTQAKQLAKHYQIPQISTGDLFRENMQNATSIGIKAKEYIQAGSLVPDDVVLEMFFDRVRKEDCRNGYVLDGIPRTLYQAEVIDAKIFPHVHFHVLCLNVDDKILFERAEGRRVCRDCGRIYHVSGSPSKVENICDACNGELFCRSDDHADVVRERLRVFHEQTKPLVKYYQEKGCLTSFDGEILPDSVHIALRDFVDKKLKH